MMRIYYDPNTGAIQGWDFGSTTIADPNSPAFVETQDLSRPSVLHHVIDLATKTKRDMTPAEKITANLPTTRDVMSARFHELTSTDWRETKAGWTEHRQALRDITKAGDAVAMVKAWPLRPDGSDAIPHLRARLPPT